MTIQTTNKLTPYNVPNSALYAVRWEPDTNAVIPMELRNARWTNPQLAMADVQKWYDTLGKLKPYQRTRLRQAIAGK